MSAPEKTKYRKREAIALAACDSCKRSKVRCIQEDGFDKCQRCHKKGAECSFATLRKSTGWISAGPPGQTQAVALPEPSIPAVTAMNHALQQGDVQISLLTSAIQYVGMMPDQVSPVRALFLLESHGRRVSNMSSKNLQAFILASIAFGARVHQTKMDDIASSSTPAPLALAAPSQIQQFAARSSLEAKAALGLGMVDITDIERAPALFALLFELILGGQWQEARAYLGACISAILQDVAVFNGSSDGWHCTIACLDIILALDCDKTPFMAEHHIFATLVPLSTPVPLDNIGTAFSAMTSHLFAVGWPMAARRTPSADRPEDRAIFDQVVRVCNSILDSCDLLEAMNAATIHVPAVFMPDSMIPSIDALNAKAPIHGLSICRTIASAYLKIVYQRTHSATTSVFSEIDGVTAPVDPSLYEMDALRAAKVAIDILRLAEGVPNAQGAYEGPRADRCSIPVYMCIRDMDVYADIIAAASELAMPISEKLDYLRVLLDALNVQIPFWPRCLVAAGHVQALRDQLSRQQSQQTTPESTGSSDFFDDYNLAAFATEMPVAPQQPFKDVTLAPQPFGLLNF